MKKRSEEPHVEQEYYSIKQGGQYIGKSYEAMRGYMHRGQIKFKKVGKLRFISKKELDRFAS